MVCGSDRWRVWRLNEPPAAENDPIAYRKLEAQLDQVIADNKLQREQLIDEYRKVQGEMREEKEGLEAQINQLMEKKRLAKEARDQMEEKINKLE